MTRPGTSKNHAVGGLFRLAYGGICAALALLAVLPAPTYLLWMVAVGVTEWGHVLALLSAAALAGRPRTRAGLAGAMLGALAMLLAISPLVRALLVARAISARIDAAFGSATPRTSPGAPPRQTPLSLRDLACGLGQAPVVPRTLVFASPAGSDLALDLYSPPQPAGPAPLVVVIHGGAWRGGDRQQIAGLNSYLAARGYAVASVSYRLAPTFQFPAQLDDLRAAITYLRTNATVLNLDASRLVLLGRSAGGQLALLAGYTDPDVRGVISFYAPADLRYAYANPTNPRVINTPEVLDGYLGGSPETAPQAYDAASPINFVGPHTPPTLLIHGSRDELVFLSQSQRLAAALERAGRTHLLIELPWATHGGDFNPAGPMGQISLYAIERLLATVTE